MRIISPFKDYYDSVAKYGIDKSCIYLREPKTLKLDRAPLPFTRHYLGFGFGSSISNAEHLWVGFCGTVYPVLVVNANYEYYSLPPKGELPIFKGGRFIYGKEAILDFISRAYSKDDEKKSYQLAHRVRLVNNWLNDPPLHTDTLFAKAPLFTCRKSHGVYHLTYNAFLKHVEFFRVFDAALTFQKLHNYLSAQAQPEKPIPAISNGDMIESKGFDKKTSFRKDKTKK